MSKAGVAARRRRSLVAGPLFAGPLFAVMLVLTSSANGANSDGASGVSNQAQQGSNEQIRVEGNRRIDAETVRSYFHPSSDGHFDGASLDAALKALIATNLFDDVKLAPIRNRPLASVPVYDADSLGIALADNVLRMPDRADRDRLRAANRETLQEIERIHGNRRGERND